LPVERECNGNEKEAEEKSHNKPSDISEGIAVPIAVAEILGALCVQDLRNTGAVVATLPNDEAGKLVGAFTDQLILELEVQRGTDAFRSQDTKEGNCRR